MDFRLRIVFQAITAVSVALLLGYAATALAVNDWGFTGCSSDGNQAGSSGVICFDFNSSISPGSVRNFSVSGGSALACFDPDLAVQGIGTATGAIYYCPSGGTTKVGCTAACAQAGCTLTGAEGLPASQLSCVVLGKGAYLFENILAPGGGQTGLFSVQGGN